MGVVSRVECALILYFGVDLDIFLEVGVMFGIGQRGRELVELWSRELNF